jgi:hypothetical protein
MCYIETLITQPVLRHVMNVKKGKCLVVPKE